MKRVFLALLLGASVFTAAAQASELPAFDTAAQLLAAEQQVLGR